MFEGKALDAVATMTNIDAGGTAFELVVKAALANFAGADVCDGALDAALIVAAGKGITEGFVVANLDGGSVALSIAVVAALGYVAFFDFGYVVHHGERAPFDINVY